MMLVLVALPAAYFYIIGRESQSQYCNSEAFVGDGVCDLAPERFAWMVALLAAPFLVGLLIGRPARVRIYVSIVTVAAVGLFAVLLATGDPNYPVFELHPRVHENGA